MFFFTGPSRSAARAGGGLGYEASPAGLTVQTTAAWQAGCTMYHIQQLWNMSLGRHVLSLLSLQVWGVPQLEGCCLYLLIFKTSFTIVTNHVFVIETIISHIPVWDTAARVLVSFGSKPAVVVAPAKCFQTHNRSLMVQNIVLTPLKYRTSCVLRFADRYHSSMQCVSVCLSVHTLIIFSCKEVTCRENRRGKWRR